jgi:methylamine dehydrogenase accessory protein MauD
MGTALLVGRLLLAAVFATAAIAKLLAPQRTAASLEDFGVPRAAVPAATYALPLAELAIAALLIPVSTAGWAALCAAALLAGFSTAITRVLARGETVDCNCFGAAAARPVGRSTLVRDVILFAIAGFVAIAGWSDGGTSAVGWIGDLSGTDAALLVVATVLGLAAILNFAFSWQLLKQNGRLVARLDELGERLERGGSRTKVGEPAPAFELPDLAGVRVDSDRLLAERRGLTLVFGDPSCGACDPLLPAIGRIQRNRGRRSPLVLVSRGDLADNRAKASEHGLETVLLDDEFELARSLGVNGMPGAVMLDVDGRIADVPAMGTEAVAELLSLLGARAADPISVIRAGV